MHCTACYSAGVSKQPSFVQLHRTLTVSYRVVILNYFGTFNAIIPDVPGCVATSTSLDEVRILITEGLKQHLPKLLASGAQLPPPSTSDYSKQLEPGDDLIEYGDLHVECVMGC